MSNLVHNARIDLLAGGRDRRFILRSLATADEYLSQLFITNFEQK
jgi:hypothetical protein